MTGAERRAVEIIASIKALIADFFMQFSWLTSRRVSLTKTVEPSGPDGTALAVIRQGDHSPDTYWDLNTGRIKTFPVEDFINSEFDHRWAQHGIHHDHREPPSGMNMTKLSWR